MFRRFKKYLTRTLNHQQKRRIPLFPIPVVDNNKFLFIGGLHRSGTSVLHRLLSEHPLTSGFQDTGVPEDEGQHLQTVFAAAHKYGGPGEFAFHPEVHLTEDSDLINQTNRELLLSEWGAYYDLQKPVLLEKSPPNLVRSRFLRQMLPNAYFVFIVRHPVAVSLATEKWSDKTITERLLHWHTAHSIMLDDIGTASNCLVIRYEDLVSSCGNYLDQICDMVNIDRFTAKESVENHNDKYFLDWERRYGSEIRTLQAVLPQKNDLLEHFGYSLTRPYVEKI